MDYPTHTTSSDNDMHFVAPADLQLMPDGQGTSTGSLLAAIDGEVQGWASESSIGSLQRHEIDTLGDHVLDAPPSTTDNTQHGASDTGMLPYDATVHAEAPVKIGARFSYKSSKYLKQWLSNHEDYPYPSKEDMIALQHQTGLSTTQIKNWMANTRRRLKNFGSSHSSPSYVYPKSTGTSPMDVPQRPGTPAVKFRSQHQKMNPLQRWVDSPPEYEPATVSDIANAVAEAQSNEARDRNLYTHHTDDSSGQSLAESSASGRDDSSGSLGSAYSHTSGESLPGPRRISRNRQRWRRNYWMKAAKTSIAAVRQDPYQCTFCSETFKTKYDWQRHEKTLHIPLERWRCAPFGPRSVNPSTGILSCVYCGDSNPNDEHVQNHHPEACQDREFRRKDHLRQHLRLVHDCGMTEWAIKSWNSQINDICSCCGFCRSVLSSWTDRVEHLANHFKLGSTMEAWSGGWGFDSEVESTLENAIAPYLIHNERTSPYPFQSSGVCPESPRTAYELLTLELSCFIESYHFRHKQKPSSQTLQLEACRIILASEVLTGDFLGLHCSWFRDLITSNEVILQQARLAPVRTPAEGRLRSLEIRGKTTLFESCPLEEEMRKTIKSCQLSTPDLLQTSYLQTRALEIIGGLCRSSPKAPFDEVSSWFLGLVFGSTNWLDGLIQRYGLKLQTDAPRPGTTPADMAIISGESFSTMDAAQLQMSAFPFDSNTLTNWDQILLASNHPFAAEAQDTLAMDHPTANQTNPGLQSDCSTENTLEHLSPSHLQLVENSDAIDADQRPSWLQNGNYILNDPNFHQWLGRELCRWATATMSSKGHDSHVPSDEEIRRQARLLLYGDDDPWNQTAVDHPEWLARFKQDLVVFRQDNAESR